MEVNLQAGARHLIHQGERGEPPTSWHRKRKKHRGPGVVASERTEPKPRASRRWRVRSGRKRERQERKRPERRGREGDTPYRNDEGAAIYKGGDTRNCPKPRGPSRKAKYSGRPIVNPVPRGKVGSTEQGVKNLKPFIYCWSEPEGDGVPFC